MVACVAYLGLVRWALVLGSRRALRGQMAPIDIAAQTSYLAR
jgi:hypothetical protein